VVPELPDQLVRGQVALEVLELRGGAPERRVLVCQLLDPVHAREVLQGNRSRPDPAPSLWASARGRQRPFSMRSSQPVTAAFVRSGTSNWGTWPMSSHISTVAAGRHVRTFSAYRWWTSLSRRPKTQ
jgi:hypothetical protein